MTMIRLHIYLLCFTLNTVYLAVIGFNVPYGIWSYIPFFLILMLPFTERCFNCGALMWVKYGQGIKFKTIFGVTVLSKDCSCCGAIDYQ